MKRQDQDRRFAELAAALDPPSLAPALLALVWDGRVAEAREILERERVLREAPREVTP